jgi:hypothetical protein
MNQTSLLLFLAAAGLAVAANGPAHRNAAAGNAACPGTCAAATTATTPVTFSPAAQAALLFQIEEERMAGELYRAFAAKWDLRPFQHIPRSEAQHEAALKALAARAGVTVPAVVAGRFVSAEVQKRYDALWALGQDSADSALRAGAFVEEQDIADLRALAATTDSADLKAVVTALENASGHHLNAFVRLLAARGVTYTPQVLPADEFATLTSAAAGRGVPGNGAGAGRGYRGGR